MTASMHCAHCSLPLTKERGRFEVHDPHGLSGVFCTARCYEQARDGKPVKRAHGDADTLMQEEGIVR